MADRDELIHGFAKRVVIAQGYDQVSKELENKNIRNEALNHNIAINEIGVYAMNNSEKLNKEIEAQKPKK